MRCIFCLKEKPPSEEHVFPEAIGGTLTINRVCTTCNGLLNERADRELIQYPTVRMLRAQLRIPDKRGKTLDPFADIFGKGTIIGGEPGEEVIPSTDPLTGRLTLKLIRHRTEKLRPDGKREIEIKIDSRDADKIPRILQRERKRAGLPELSGSNLDRAVSEILARGVSEIRHSLVRHQPVIRFTDPKRGILKIVYELAWYWLGDDYLNDECAQQLRQVILSDGALDEPTLPKIRGSISVGEVVPALVLWNHMPNIHLAMMSCVGSHVGVAVRVFSTLSAIVGVSDDPARYPHLGERGYMGNFVKLDPISRGMNESTLGAAISDLCSKTPGADRPKK
jgi:hypothetical protein